MTEKELRRLWWWRDKNAWLKIADKLGGHFPSKTINKLGKHVPCKKCKKDVVNICKIEYERVAFHYEVQARAPKPEKIAYPLGVPFPDLTGKDIFDWRKRFLSQAWRNAGAVGSRRPGVELSSGELSFDGIMVTPKETTPALFQKAILQQVERMMRDQNLKWGTEEYFRKKPWPWNHLENADRYVCGLPLVERPEMRNAESVMRITLRKYGKP